MEGGNSVAEFSDSIRIGEVDSGHTEIGSGGMKVYRYADNAQIELANIGYGRSASESGISTTPYYTMGKRATDAETDIGNYSMVEGINNTAKGVASHVEGRGNTTSGHYSHVEGRDNTATASYTHVGGVGNTANALAQTVIGKYSKSVGSDDLFVIGNGTGTSNNERSTALRVKSNGSLWSENGITSDLVFDTRSDMFGMITRMSTNVYQLFFMTNGAMYKSLINTSNNPPTADTQRLYTLNDIKNTYFTISDGGNTVTPKAELATLLQDYSKVSDIPEGGYVTAQWVQSQGYTTENFVRGLYGACVSNDTLADKVNTEISKGNIDVYTESEINTKLDAIDGHFRSTYGPFKNAVDAILKGYGLIE